MPPQQDLEDDATTPIVIIGAGACGLSAALAAREAGVAPIVLERDASPAGSTSLSQGLIPAAGTALQRRAGVDDSVDLMAHDIQAKARGCADPAIVRALCEGSGPAIDWLQQVHGLDLHLVTDFLYPGMSRHRMHGMPNQNGAELQSGLLAACERHGIDIVTEARARELVADGDGRVTEIAIERPGGAIERLRSQAVVLACNGYGGNPEMIARLIPEIAAAEYWGHAGNTGDAIAWGNALGAGTGDLGAYQGHGSVAVGYGLPLTWAIVTGGGIQVNLHGERFADEMRGYSEHAVEVLQQPGRIAWSLYDANSERPALAFEEYRQLVAMGGVKTAACLEDLATVTRLPLDTLRATLAQVASHADGATQDRFGRDFTATPKLLPPFRAVRTTGALFHTQGGLLVDAEARVLRPDGSRLPNLFAGGGAARGVSGNAVWGYLSGNGLLSAVAGGAIAAGTLVASLKESK